MAELTIGPREAAIAGILAAILAWRLAPDLFRAMAKVAPPVALVLLVASAFTSNLVPSSVLLASAGMGAASIILDSIRR